MLAAAPLQAAPNTIVQVTTPLHGLAVNEELVLRAIDLQGIARRPARLTASFLSEDAGFVRTVSARLPPGEAFTFRLPYSALGTNLPFPGVHMVIALELPGSGDDNQVQLSYEFFNVETSQARPGVSCAQPAHGGRETMKCDGAAIDVFPAE
jgi:hypothetical protein